MTTSPFIEPEWPVDEPSAPLMATVVALVPDESTDEADNEAAIEHGTIAVVDFHPWEYIRAHDVGIRRAVANWGKADSLDYQNSKTMQPERTSEAAAALCEYAVAKYLDLNWSAHEWSASAHESYRHLADVGQNIEVRRVRSPSGRATVKPKDVKPGFNFVVAYAVPEEFRQVQILGWLPVEEAWEIGTPANHNRRSRSRTVALSQLRPISTYHADNAR